MISIKGMVKERESRILTLELGILKSHCKELKYSTNPVPPFTLDENTDGGDELRMKYRYLDIEETPLKII